MFLAKRRYTIFVFKVSHIICSSLKSYSSCSHHFRHAFSFPVCSSFTIFSDSITALGQKTLNHLFVKSYVISLFDHRLKHASAVAAVLAMLFLHHKFLLKHHFLSVSQLKTSCRPNVLAKRH